MTILSSSDVSREPLQVTTPPLARSQGEVHHRESDSLIDPVLVRFHIYASIFWLLYLIVGGGLLVALKFTWPDFLSHTPALGWGRLRFVHTQTVAYGWFINVFFAATYYMVPKLTNVRLASGRAAWFCFFYYNTCIAIGTIALLSGHNLGIEWMEYPSYVNLMIIPAFAVLAYNFFLAYARSKERNLYVSSWYLMAFVAWALLNWIMGGLVPAYVAPGIAGAAIGGLFIHDLVGLIVTPVATATIYYLLPVLTRRPIYSHSLSLLGFWSLAFFYPLVGVHHYYYSPIPMWAQYIAQGTSIMLLFTVYTVVYNVYKTMQGRWIEVADNIPLRWLLAGVVFYLMVCTQGPLQALLLEQPLIHFSDWVVGHSHMALLGFGTFVMMAFIHFAWPRIGGRALNRTLCEWSFWLTFVGSSWMFIDLWIGGLMEGHYWAYGYPWYVSIVALKGVWMSRTLSGIVILAGFILIAVNLWRSRPLSNTMSAPLAQPA